MKQKTITHSLVIILIFLFAFYGKRLLNIFVEVSFSSNALKVIYFYSWWLIPVFITLGVLFGFRNIFKELRIHKGFFSDSFFLL